MVGLSAQTWAFGYILFFFFSYENFIPLSLSSPLWGFVHPGGLVCLWRSEAGLWGLFLVLFGRGSGAGPSRLPAAAPAAWTELQSCRWLSAACAGPGGSWRQPRWAPSLLCPARSSLGKGPGYPLTLLPPAGGPWGSAAERASGRGVSALAAPLRGGQGPRESRSCGGRSSQLVRSVPACRAQPAVTRRNGPENPEARLLAWPADFCAACHDRISGPLTGPVPAPKSLLFVTAKAEGPAAHVPAGRAERRGPELSITFPAEGVGLLPASRHCWLALSFLSTQTPASFSHFFPGPRPHHGVSPRTGTLEMSCYTHTKICMGSAWWMRFL